MKNLLALITCMVFGLSMSMAQSSPTDLTANEIFEKVINYYDPGGIWDTYKGSMHIFSIHDDRMARENLSINNAEKNYKCVQYINEKPFVREIRNGNTFYKVNGKELTADEVPAQFQEEPYRLTDHFTKMFREHHTFHFSAPLALKSAGATPLAEVEKENIFGTDCLAIRFSGLPDNFKPGGYNGAITLYINPADNFKLHAMLLDNGWYKDKKGMLNLYSGEIEVAGLKIPARRLFFHAADNSFGFIDAFDPVTTQDY